MLKKYLLRGGAPLALTSSMEDYLETVHILQKKYGNVRNIDISLHLGVTKPSVSRAVKELSKMGYLIKQADGTLSLTETGLTIASRLVSFDNMLSHQAEMQRTQINNYCRNQITRLDIDVLARLCTVLNCEIGDLLEFVPPEEIAKEK